jgi:hypothetical protein
MDAETLKKYDKAVDLVENGDDHDLDDTDFPHKILHKNEHGVTILVRIGRGYTLQISKLLVEPE